MGRHITAIFVTATLATPACAAFMGYTIDGFSLGNGHFGVNIYAQFSHANDRVLNAYNAQITTTFGGGFYQSASNPFWKPGNTQNKTTSDDSWLTIGTNPNGSGNAGGNGGNVVADPNFVNFDDSNDATDFSTIQGIGGGAGWYNGNPANTYGYAFDSNRVLLAHFVSPDAYGGSNHHIFWNVSLTCIFNGASGSTSGVGTGMNDIWFGPAPGALPMLALGLVARRRRR